MDELKTTIDTLLPDRQRDFLLFIKQQKGYKDRKDVALFQLLQQKKPYSPAEIQQKIYPEAENTMAYYALRKRLMRQLTEFIFLKRTLEDASETSWLVGNLALVNYLFEAGAEKLAWNFLLKAEKIAAEAEQFDLLNAIYNLQIEKADHEHAPPLEQIIAKRNANKLAADEEERTNIAASLIRKQLNNARLQGRNLNFDQVIEKVLQEYKLSEVVLNRPSLFYKLMVIVRSAVLARNDFYLFEPYILEQFRQTESKPGFFKQHNLYRLSLLYMIAHVLYRTRKFSESEKYLAQLFEALKYENKTIFVQFYPKYIFLLTANQAFTRRLPEASALMEELLEKYGSALPIKDLLTAKLGLSFIYFAAGNFKKANLLLTRLAQTDKFCEKKMGKEWVFKKNLGEIIIQVELGNYELALNKIRTAERVFKSLLAQEAFRNAKGYLQLIKQFLQLAEFPDKEAFRSLVAHMLEFSPPAQEDLPEISFYAWMKAKIKKRPYYEILLELAAGKPEQKLQEA